MDDFRASDLGIVLLLVASAFFAGCVANRKGDMSPTMDAAIVKLLKGHSNGTR